VSPKFGGYTNQKANDSDLKQIPLREVHRKEQPRCDIKVHQSPTHQCDPTEIVGDSSNQLQSSEVAHGETSWIGEVKVKKPLIMPASADRGIIRWAC
jgi:hypothetical protein